jgi:hypothetical protein
LRESVAGHSMLALRSIGRALSDLFATRSVTVSAAAASADLDYWRVRTALGKVAFYVRRFIFYRREGNRSRAIASRVSATFLGEALLRLPLVFLTFALGVFLDRVAHRLSPILTVRAIHLPGISDLSAEAVIIGIFGSMVVVLGLYFAAISVIASTAYQKVQGDVRELLLKEVTSNAFLRLNAATATYDLILLGAKTFGYHLAYGTLAIAFVATALTLESFVSVGLRSFRLFDPKYLVPILQGDITHAITSATVKGFGYSDPSLQTAYHAQAVRDLTAYTHLLDTASDLPDTISALAEFGFDLFWFYESVKSRIPVTSRWFSRRYEYKDWLIADEPQLSLALNTSTRIIPVEVIESSWFEDDLSVTIARAMERIHEQQQVEFIAAFDRKLSTSIQRASYCYAVPESLALSKRLIPGFVRFIGSKPPTDDRQFALVQIDVADTIAGMAVSTLVGLLRRIEEVTPATLAAFVRGTMNEVPINSPLPRTMLDILRGAAAAWQFERSAEGRVVTPVASVSESLSREFVLTVLSHIHLVLDHLVNDVQTALTTLLRSEQWLAAAALAQRLLEAFSKAKHVAGLFETLVGQLRPDQLLIDAPWPDIPFNDISARLATIKRSSIVAIIEAAAELPAGAPFDDRQPDVLGQAYHVVAEEAFKALTDRDVAMFHLVSEPLVRLAFLGIARITRSYPGRTARVAIGQIVEDLVDLSGYAIIYSELNGADYWTPLRDAWDARVLHQADGPDRVSAIVNLAHFSAHQYAITPRSVLRVHWTQALEKRLQDEHMSNKSHFYPNYTFEPPLRVRRNPTIRALIAGRSLSSRPFDVFVTSYVWRRGINVTFDDWKFQGYVKRREAARHESARRQEHALLNEVRRHGRF